MKILKKHTQLIFFALLLMCVVVPPAVALGSSEALGEGNKTYSMLYEIYTPALNSSQFSHVYSSLLKQAPHNAVVLVHNGQAGLDCNSGHDTNNNINSVSPKVVIDGHITVPTSGNNSLAESLAKAADPTSHSNKCKLSLYLSCALSKDKEKTVLFSVCNVSDEGTFNGYFTLWMVENTEFTQGQWGWLVTNCIKHQSIDNLPPARKEGCALPDAYAITKTNENKEYAIVGIVYGADSVVQSVVLYKLPRDCTGQNKSP